MHGLAILSMCLLHLFCRLDYEGLFRPLLFLFGKPLIYYFAQLSDFCVMAFAFCTGYGHSVLLGEDAKSYYKDRGRALLRLLLNFWIVLILFSGLSLALGKGSVMPASAGEFFANMFLVSNSFNGAWWYLSTYVLLVLTSVPVIRMIRRFPLTTGIVLSAVYLLSYLLRFRWETDSWTVRQLYLYGMTVFEYAMGAYCQKYKVFSAVTEKVRRLPLAGRIPLALVLTAGMLLLRGTVVPSLFVAPFTGIVILLLFHLLYQDTGRLPVTEFLGRHSANIWLTHLFFVTSHFGHLAYRAVYPVPVLLFLLLLSLGVSLLVKGIMFFPERWIFRRDR